MSREQAGISLGGSEVRDDVDGDSGADMPPGTMVFPGGIPGFPDHERFVLVDIVEDGIFQRLQSLDDADVAMIVCVPWLFFPDYSPELGSIEQEELGIERPEDAIVFCPVTLAPDHDRVYLNLLGPFVVHGETLQGRQLVLTGSDYPTRAAVDFSSD